MSGSAKHIIAVSKSAVASIPWAGGPLASLLGDYLPDACKRRAFDWLAQLDRRLRGIEVNQERFGFLLQLALPTAAIDHREFKRHLLANILADAANDGDADVSLYRLFIDIVDAMEPHHIKLLRRIRERTAVIDEDFKWEPAKQQEMAGVEFDQLGPLIECDSDSADSGTRRALTVQAVSFLTNQGIVSARPKGGEGKGAQGRIALTGSLNPSVIWYTSSFILTPVGKRFCEYLEGDGATA